MQEEYEHCPIEDTFRKLGALAEIEIPEEEFDESPQSIRKSVAEQVRNRKKAEVAESNSQAALTDLASISKSLS